MTIISGALGSSPIGYEDNPYLSGDLSSYAWSAFEPTPHVAGAEFLAGAYSAFRSTKNGLGSIAGSVGHSFRLDYYDRIHVTPALFDVGNLTSSQTRELYVWNAYHDAPHLLSEIAEYNTDGINLAQPEFPPTYLAPLEERTYTVNITTNGPPDIDARYEFVFDDGVYSVGIRGSRVVAWAFVPQRRHTERLEWQTDVIASFNGEQRLALRNAPRQSFEMTFLLDQYQFARARAVATNWAHRVYGVPVWSELSYVGPLEAGAMFIAADTRWADYRPNDLVVLIDGDKYLTVETTTVSPTGVGLKLPLPTSFDSAYMAPVRFARAPSGIQFERDASDITTAKATFVVTRNVSLAADIGLPKYRGKDVLNNPLVIVGSMNERVSRAVDEFDNGSGPIVVDIRNNWVQSRRVLTFDLMDRAERWAARQWLHAVKGKQKSFWLPTWNSDLILAQDAPSGQSLLVVRPIGYPEHYTVRDVMVRKTDGTVLYLRILSGGASPDGSERLVLESPLTQELRAADVEIISFLDHVRFDTDQITITHLDANRATINAPVVEVPE